MNRIDMSHCIGIGAQAYLRAFSQASCMELHTEGGAEWICPKPAYGGPSILYRLSVEDADAEHHIDELIDGIKAGRIPSLWFASPDWKPENIVELLLSKGFQDLSNPSEPEPAMALELKDFAHWPEPDPGIFISKVDSQRDFISWCRIVNDVLHGWEMVTADHYSAWLNIDDIALYLAWRGDIPVSAVATVRDGDCVSLEFVATLPEHRRHGAATAACTRALDDLKAANVKVATLRAFHDGVRLYEKLGFKTYYNTTLLSYPHEKGE